MTGSLGPGQFALGTLVLGVMLACTGAAAALLVRRWFDQLRGAPRAVAVAVLWIAGLLAVEIVPLALGVLSRGSVLVASVVLALAASRLARTPAGGNASRWRDAVRALGPDAIGLGSLSWLLAAAGLLLTGAWWLAYLEFHATYQPVSVDALSFHLPGVIRFIQTGSLWHTAQYLPGEAQGNYPQYGDLMMLAMALPWRSVALVRYADPVLLGLAALGVYAIGRELRAPASSATLAALALVAIRPTLAPALIDVLTDPLFLAGFAAGVLFLLRHWRTGSRSELVLSGVGFGLALGTKWYGITDVPALIAIWILALVIFRRPLDWRARGGDAVVLVATTLLAGGVWLLRNLILTGNPVFDYKVNLLGVTIFGAPPNPIRHELAFTIAHYLGDTSVLRTYVWPVFRSDFGVTGALIGLGALGTGVVWSVRRGDRDGDRDPRLMLMLAGALLLAGAYLVTPYSAQGFAGAPVLVNANTRYGAPALLLAAPLLAWLAGRLGRFRVVLEGGLLACIVVNLNRYLGDAGTRRVVLTALGLLVVAALGWLAASLGRGQRTRPAPDAARARAAGAALAGVLACVGILAAYHYQRVLARRPYVPDDPTVAYVLARTPAHARIAITGQWTAQGLVPVAPLFGPRLHNRVSYIGPFVEHRLEEYKRAAPFVAALRRGHFQYLEIGTGFPPRPDPPEAQWARAAGYRPLVSSGRLLLMQAPGA